MANSKTAAPDSKTSPEAPVWQGPAPPGLIAAQPRPLDREVTSGMALGIIQGVTPFGTSMDGLATASGLGYRGSPRYQFAKSFGQAIGGLALTLLGTGGTLGGMGLNLSGIGAAVGVPAVALSFAIMTAGTANVLAGVNGMWQSLSTGGGAGPPGVSAGPAAPVKPFGKLAHAPKYGVQSYAKMQESLKGSGLQAHHPIPARFDKIMGEHWRQMKSIAVSSEEHQLFTNRWRQKVPYGTNPVDRQQVFDFAREIYADYPAILEALGL